MNQIATKTTGMITAVMTAVLITAFAAVMTVSAQTGPERPTDLTATAVDHDTVSLTWSHPDPASVDHYQVLSRRVDSSARIAQVGTSTTTTFEHDGLEPESTYIYRVRPVNSQAQEGQRSARAEATTPAEETTEPEPDPTPAQPQRSDDEGQDNTARSSHDVLVSNTGQAAEDNQTETQNRAQSFTTGTNPAGYVLSSIVVGYNDTAGDTFSAAVWTTNSSGAPNALKHSLTAPTTISQGDLTFTAPANATLDASTTYAVVMDLTNTNGVTFTRTSTENPDEDSGAAAGWSIGDTYHYFSFTRWVPSSTNKPHLITIHGAPSTADATLSALVLQDASDNSVLTLDPTFDSATLEYGATVGRDVGEITIIPTPTDTDADYEIQDGDGTALDDADTTQDEFQVSIARGLNTIQIEVTAEDDATNQTYAVTVTRPRILVSSNGQTSGGSAITGNNAGTQTKHAPEVHHRKQPHRLHTR